MLVRESLVQLVDEAFPHFSARPSTLTLKDLLRDCIRRSDNQTQQLRRADRSCAARGELSSSPPVLAIVTDDDASRSAAIFPSWISWGFPFDGKGGDLNGSYPGASRRMFFLSVFICV